MESIVALGYAFTMRYETDSGDQVLKLSRTRKVMVWFPTVRSYPHQERSNVKFCEKPIRPSLDEFHR